MKLKVMVGILAFTLAPLSARALLGTEMGVRGGGWLPQLSGELRLDGAGIDGVALDLKDDLGLDDSFSDGLVPSGEAFVRLGKNRISLAGALVDYKGSETFAAPARFGDVVFGGEVRSRLQYTMFDGAYERTLIDLENWLAGFSVGAILQVKYLDGEAELKDASAKESVSFGIPMPLVGLGAHLGILADWIEVRLRAVGMAYSGNQVVDAFGEIILSPFPFVDLAVGYRYVTFDVRADKVVGGSGDVVVEFRQAGPYLTLTAKIGL